MGVGMLKPLIDYDEKHNASYVETLECFLETGGSYQAMAELMYVHRNTLMYRMNNIKKLLGTDLESVKDRLPYHIACLIRKMN
jgi:DNA-binding PucR family transcriptional regulator